ncbi:hydrolase, NUDIX family protein [Salinibacter ruber DSM 13855]|uniref:GDP-mannose pyrophosphatase n=3 Tax=Salinibacter ruber TaxID=146919 RepID=Q2S0R0_SALRD|nr:hydrolase, NUDIX family protein [Salinibacter ruber DSM 13855]CBH25257.1 ADP-ribose pyrophosphatase [Salinibacter ruber M8]
MGTGTSSNAAMRPPRTVPSSAARPMSDLTEAQLSSEQLVDGALLKAFRDEVRLPNGQTSVREWIDHPGASAIVPVFEDGRTLLVRQFRYPPRRAFLEVPAGKIDEPGEAPADVAARELEEETGWQAGRFEHVGTAYPCIGYSNEQIHVFTAHDLDRGTQALADGEFVEVVEVDFETALARARHGDLRDMKTVTALVYAAAHLNESSAAP